MHASIPAITLLVLGVGAIAYGGLVMAVGSGTLFHAVWFAIGTALVALAAMVATGAWAALPASVRRGSAAVAALLAAAVLASGCAVASGMGAHGRTGLDYIVVLGAQVREDGPSAVLRYRLDAACAYLEANPGTGVVVSGGQGPNEPWSEAHGMASYLVAKGIDRTRIIEEPASASTRENLVNSFALIAEDRATGGGEGATAEKTAPKGARAEGPDIGIVTNDFHVYRALRTARRLGHDDVCGIAAYSTPAYLPNNLLRESLGLIRDVLIG